MENLFQAIPHPQKWPAQIEDIFFDLDNTLWDHRANARLTLQHLFPDYKNQLHYSGDFASFYAAYEKSNDFLWDQISLGNIGKEELRARRFPEALNSLGIDDKQAGLQLEDDFLETITDYNELVSGAEELLQFLLSKNYRLHILSNGFMEVTGRKVELSALNGLFSTITSADEIGIRKPEPEIFQYALAKSYAHPATSVMIGDDWYADIVGAENYGIASIYLITQFGPPATPFPRVVQNLTEVKIYF